MNAPRPFGLSFVASGCLLLAAYTLVLLILTLLTTADQPNYLAYLLSIAINVGIGIGLFRLEMWARYFMMLRAVFTVLKMQSVLTKSFGITQFMEVLTVLFSIIAFLYLLYPETKQLFQNATREQE